MLAAKAPNATQQWQLVDGPNDTFKLVNVASGLCMDAHGADTDPGTAVDRYGCDPNGADQQNELWVANAFELATALRAILCKPALCGRARSGVVGQD